MSLLVTAGIWGAGVTHDLELEGTATATPSSVCRHSKGGTSLALPAVSAPACGCPSNEFLAAAWLPSLAFLKASAERSFFVCN